MSVPTHAQETMNPARCRPLNSFSRLGIFVTVLTLKSAQPTQVQDLHQSQDLRGPPVHLNSIQFRAVDGEYDAVPTGSRNYATANGTARVNSWYLLKNNHMANRHVPDHSSTIFIARFHSGIGANKPRTSTRLLVLRLAQHRCVYESNSYK